MCLIDFGMPVEREDELPFGSNVPLESHGSSRTAGAKQKRKHLDHPRPYNKNNFDFFVFRDPALFVGQLSENSLLLIEKQWMEVVRNFNSPVDRHIFGT